MMNNNSTGKIYGYARNLNPQFFILIQNLNYIIWKKPEFKSISTPLALLYNSFVTVFI